MTTTVRSLIHDVSTPRRQWLQVGTGLALLGISGVSWQAWRGRTAPTDPIGAWTLARPGLPVVRLTLTRPSGSPPTPGDPARPLSLASEPLRIAEDPAWQPFRRAWKQRTGHGLDALMWRGEGQWRPADGAGSQLEIALQLLAAGPRGGDGEPLDTGRLQATLPAGRIDAFEARLWWASEPQESAVSLQRDRR